jgi:signal transduction histidine kinase
MWNIVIILINMQVNIQNCKELERTIVDNINSKRRDAIYPYIATRDGVVMEVSHSFAGMVNYSTEELIKKSVTEVFNILRIGPNINLEKIDSEAEYFLFNKSLEVKFVRIKVEHKNGTSIYSFSVIPNCTLESRLGYATTLCKGSYYGIGIYSVPDITLLKANEKYVNFKDKGFNTMDACVGRHIWEFATGFKGSTYEDLWKEVLRTGEPKHIEEFEYTGLNRGVTYWRISVTPVAINGELKYCVVMTTEVTEEVLHRRKIIEQNKMINMQKAQLEAIIQNIDDAIFIYDSNRNYYMENKAAKEYFPNIQLSKLGDAYDNAKYYDLDGKEIPFEDMTISKVFRDKVIIKDKITLKNSKFTKHISVNGRPIYDSDGKLKFAVLCSRDITHDVEAEKTIKSQKELLEAIINNMSDALMVFDKNGKYILKNKAAIDNMNAGCFSNVGDSYKKGQYFDLEGNEIPITRIPAMRVLNGENIREQILFVKIAEGERYVGVSGMPLYSDSGEFLMGVVCTRDITESEMKNKLIQRQKAELEAVIESMPDVLAIINADGSYRYLNSRSDEMVYESKDIKVFGESFSHTKYYDMDGRELEINDMPALRVLKGEKVRDILLKSVGPDRIKYFSISGSPIQDEKGSISAAVICNRDISELMENQQALRENQLKLLRAELEKNEALEKALEMKDEFLSLISHELRTPLNVINTAIQAIQVICKDELSDKAKGYIKMIKQNMFRQLRLVNNLLDITRANAGKVKINKKNLDIVLLTNSIIHSVHTYASQKGIKITALSSFKKKVIGIDDEKYERILLNLLSNAIKFTPEGKSIIVKMRTVKSNICIEVIDKGIGIPVDKIDVIFEKFGQVDSSLSRQAEGAGIGLSLVKKFIEASGGSISVKSKAGKGSTFTILLPDAKVIEENTDKPMIELLDNRLVEITNVEFSDIYL